MSESIDNKPQPVKRRRRTFGGANGVWWRYRRTPKNTTRNNNDSPSSSSKSPTQSNDDGSPKASSPSVAEIEWDEDLCRPIYRTKTPNLSSSSSTEGGASIVVSDGNEEASPDSSPTPSSPTSTEAPSTKDDSSTVKSLWTNAPVKRNKSFATRKRPYSFLLLEASNHHSSSQSSTFQEEDTQSTSNASNASTTLSFSEANDDPKPITTTNNNKRKRRPRRVLQKDEAVLQKAKQFFEQLDATHSLKVESSSSPSGSSKITRTSYKLNLQSPRIQKEYQAYSKASKESGVTPWSLETYAASRRDFFRKRELFDGFLDD